MNTLDINAQMAAALAIESGESVIDLTIRINAQTTVRESKLKDIIEAAKTAKDSSVDAKNVATKTVTRVAPGATKRQRRNYNLPTRNIYAFTSASLNSVLVVTNALFDGKTSANQVSLLVRSKKNPAEFMAAPDLECNMLAEDIPFGNELDQAKVRFFNQFRDAGYTMIGNCPRVKLDAVVEVDATTEVDHTTEN